MNDPRTTRSHPHYGICPACRQLKHVTPEGLIHDHNRFAAEGTVVVTNRCGGSGEPYLAGERPAELTA